LRLLLLPKLSKIKSITYRQGEVVVFAGVEFREVEVVKFLRVVWVEVVVMVNPHLLENEK